MTCPQLIDSGAYVLGALPPASRSAYERHLPGCAECRAEVSALAGLPGLLGRLDTVPSAPAPDPAPPSVVAGALLRVRRQRHRRRLVASFAALAIAAVALVAGLALPRASHPAQVVGPSPTTSTIDGWNVPLTEMNPVAGAEPVTAQIGLVPVQGGTEVYMTCEYGSSPQSGAEYGKLFSLWVVSRGHGEQAIGWWKANPGETIRIPGVTSWPIAGMKRVELRDEDNHPVLTLNIGG